MAYEKNADALRRRKHLAIEIVAQLPDDPDEAKRILWLAGELIETFLVERACQPALKVIR